MADITDKNPTMADSSSSATATVPVPVADFSDRNTLVTTIGEVAAHKELVGVGPNLDVDIQSMGISQDSDNSDGSCANVNQDQEAANPLLIPVVSSCLFDYMDVAGLKNARLVCKAWAEAGASKLIKKATILVDGAKRGSTWNSFSTIMGQTPTNRFQKYTIENIKASRLESIINSTGQHIKKLIASSPADPSVLKVAQLRNIVLKCPNLEELIMFCHEEDFTFTSASAKLVLPGDNKLTLKLKKMTLIARVGIHPKILMDLLNACPHLNNLSVVSIGPQFTMSTILLQLGVSGKVKLDRLNELNLGRVNNYTIGLFERLELNLSTLRIRFMADVDQFSVANMLEHLSGTLTTFSCEYEQAQDNINLVLVLHLDFPANMTRLTKIEIHTDTNLFFVEAIKSALKLPNLKILLLVKRLDVRFGMDFDTCWNLMKLDTNTARCLSLKTLQLPFGLTSGHIFTEIATVFPNVTDLGLHDSSEEVIAAVFANYSNLERLSIKMHSFTPNMDSVLTGLNTKWCKTMLQKKKFKFANSTQVTHKRRGLKDMKRLKYFELREHVNSSNLTEVTLYHGLAYLTRAVQLDLQGCQQFTEGGIEELKSALGPCCFVNINKEEGGDHFWSYSKELYSR